MRIDFLCPRWSLPLGFDIDENFPYKQFLNCFKISGGCYRRLRSGVLGSQVCSFSVFDDREIDGGRVGCLPLIGGEQILFRDILNNYFTVLLEGNAAKNQRH